MKQVFVRRERALWTGTWAGSESQALLIAESRGAFLRGFLWPVILLCLVLSLIWFISPVRGPVA